MFDKMTGIEKIDIKTKYLSRLLKNFTQKKKINIVWDAGNGSAGEIMKNLSDFFEGKKLYFSIRLMVLFLIIIRTPSEEKI